MVQAMQTLDKELREMVQAMQTLDKRISGGVRMTNLELSLFSEGEWVIIGDHLSLEDARDIAKKEDPEHSLSFTEVKR